MPRLMEYLDEPEWNISGGINGIRIDRPKWIHKSSCRGEDTNIFYPAPGDVDKLRLAKQICKECVVRKDCLQHALDNNERFGIWGGKSARERSLILRAQRLLDRGNHS
jgi:WhiB family redox-sensing transcriptional regulator